MLSKDYYIILSVLESINKILRYTAAYQSAEELYQNDRDFDAAMMNFIVLGEESGKLSDSIKKTILKSTGQKYMDYGILLPTITLASMSTLCGK